MDCYPPLDEPPFPPSPYQRLVATLALAQVTAGTREALPVERVAADFARWLRCDAPAAEGGRPGAAARLTGGRR